MARRKKNSFPIDVAISLVFHGLLVAAAVFIAAREGVLGTKLKTLAVSIAPKEKPPEKPKEEPRKPEPEARPVEQKETPKVQARPVEARATPTRTAPPPLASTAPPAADIPSFVFSEGAVAVNSTSDPKQLYKGQLETFIRSRWKRPENLDDAGYAAEVEVRVGRDGQLTASRWTAESGNPRWDKSVRDTFASLPPMSKAPPQGFPPEVRIRFDVVEEEHEEIQ